MTRTGSPTTVGRVTAPRSDSAGMTAGEAMTCACEVIPTDMCVWEVLERFFRTGSSHLIVAGQDGRIEGIINAQRLARLWARDACALRRMSLRTLPHGTWVELAPDTPLADAARVLTWLRIDALPVCDDDHRLLGVLTAGSVVAAYARYG